MSRSLTSGMVTEVTAKALHPLILLKAAFDGGDLNLWSGVGSLTWNGDTYTGAGDLLSMSQVTENNLVEAQNTTFTLSGIPSAILSDSLNEDYQGRKISAWFACADDTGAIIADPYLFFKGQMDVLSPTVGGDTMTLAMSCESRTIDISRAKELRYTSEVQKAASPGDLGLDFVSSLQDAMVVWGRPSP